MLASRDSWPFYLPADNPNRNPFPIESISRKPYQTPIGWPNSPRKVGEPDGLLLLRVDQTIVRLVVSNPLETAHAVPRHRRGRGVRAGRLQRQSGSQSLVADSPRGGRRPRISQLQCV